MKTNFDKKTTLPTTFKKIGCELLISLLIGVGIGAVIGFLLQPSAFDLIGLIS